MAQDRQLTAAHQARSKSSSQCPRGLPTSTALDGESVGPDPGRHAESGDHDYSGDVGPSPLNLCIFCR